MPEDWATFGVDLHLETDAGTGRRSGLERALRDAIRSGRLAPHARLPSTRALAADLGLSRGTVSAAFDQLVAEGFLAVRQGSGTIVSDLPQRPSPAGEGRPGGADRVPRHDLRPGRPDVSLFPVAAWLRATRRALGGARSEIYGYGDPRGRIELRTALAEYLGRARGVLAAPDQIVITSGYVQALALLARVLGAAGTAAIAMEDPGLEFHREVVRRSGLTALPLPVDDRGARTETLTGITGRAAGAVVVTPAHQYPTGATLHPARRHALAEWARDGGRPDHRGRLRRGVPLRPAAGGCAAGHSPRARRVRRHRRQDPRPGTPAGLDGAAGSPGRAGGRGEKASRHPH